MKKYYLFALAPIVIAAYFWLFSTAFALLSAASDLAVMGGLALLAGCIFTIIKLLFYVRRKF